MRKIGRIIAKLFQKQLHIHRAAQPDYKQHNGQHQRSAQGIHGVNGRFEYALPFFFKYSLNGGRGVG